MKGNNILSIILFFLLFTTITFSCNQSTTVKVDDNGEFLKLKKAKADSTIEGTIKASTEYSLQFDEQIQLQDKSAFIAKHKDEILKTLQIVDKDSIPGKDIVLVFYKYSVGKDTVKLSTYMKPIDGKWYIHSKYYSSYDDDPFENGKGEEAKKLLLKSDEWVRNNKDIWWR
ncbi:hypothetical protein ACQ33O_12155 [Ferruginibacter sp. SUN002]|uniref:hypothetical protein n=1 Tax=Ferruginibacter sp. SUN002 TaxID=2937789 RepID=UPI003D36BE95